MAVEGREPRILCALLAHPLASRSSSAPFPIDLPFPEFPPDALKLAGSPVAWGLRSGGQPVDEVQGGFCFYGGVSIPLPNSLGPTCFPLPHLAPRHGAPANLPPVWWSPVWGPCPLWVVSLLWGPHLLWGTPTPVGSSLPVGKSPPPVGVLAALRRSPYLLWESPTS